MFPITLSGPTFDSEIRFRTALGPSSLLIVNHLIYKIDHRYQRVHELPELKRIRGLQVLSEVTQKWRAWTID